MNKLDLIRGNTMAFSSSYTRAIKDVAESTFESELDNLYVCMLNTYMLYCLIVNDVL